MNAKELGNIPAYPRNYSSDGHNGLTKREAFAMAAPADEIDAMTGTYAKDAAELIGVSLDEYKPTIHYVQVLAKARFMWADAMLAEAAKESP